MLTGKRFDPMLPSHIDSLLREQVATDLRTKGAKLRELHRRAAEKAVSTGIVVDGIRARDCALEIQRRAQLIAEAIRKVLAEVKLSPYSGLISDLVTFYDAEFDRVVAEWRPHVMEAWSTRPFPGGGDGGLSSDLDDWRAEHRMDIKRLGAAIMEPALRTNTVSISVNNSQIGVIQTGDGAASAGSISLSQSESAALRDALSALSQALDKIPATNQSKRAELKEVIVDVETELAKPVPNTTKLGALLSTVAASIKSVEILQNAYDTISRVLHKFGFDVLP